MAADTPKYDIVFALRGMSFEMGKLKRDGDSTLAYEASDEIAALRAEVARLTTCSCGRTLSTGQCGICDNDD